MSKAMTIFAAIWLVSAGTITVMQAIDPFAPQTFMTISGVMFVVLGTALLLDAAITIRKAGTATNRKASKS